MATTKTKPAGALPQKANSVRRPKRTATGTRLGLVEGHLIDRFYDVQCAEKLGEQICRATGIEDDFESHIAWITNQAAFWQDLARRASVIAAYCKKYNPDDVPLGLGQELSCYSHPRYEFCGGGER